ncbi:Rne/Rng family ribonuclease [Nocardioides sp. BP30]|uniref:Rne/Rng family ribonuclease n=1 Tax=Nocardioides sp. BP30 TaxID=3036374 RepID=UPI0024682784|nr:Rne/Rng family ribonuclease [Nocardioides sp. BP30]WGL53585.1 Rne/Rng family ribonuclease [Nocardioides sp. BP30]
MADDSTVETQNNGAEQAGGAPEAASTPAKKTAARTSTAKKTATAKKAAAKKAPAKKAPAKKAPAKKAAAAGTAPEGAAAEEAAPAKTAAKRAPRKRAAAPAGSADQPLLDVPATDAPAADPVADGAEAPAKKTAARKSTAAKKTTTARKATAKKTVAEPVPEPAQTPAAEAGAEPEQAPRTTKRAAAKTAKTTATKAPAKRATKKAAAPVEAPTEPGPDVLPEAAAETASPASSAGESGTDGALGVLFQAPEKTPRKRPARKRAAAKKPVEEIPEEVSAATSEDDEDQIALAAVEADAVGDAAAAEATAGLDEETDETADETTDETEADDESGAPARRRRRRGGRRRRKSGEGGANNEGDENEEESSSASAEDTEDQAEAEDTEEQAEGGSSRRRRRRRRAGDSGGNTTDDDPENTVTRVRDSRPLEQQITAVSGSTRLEAKKQRRREGREAGRRRAPIVSEAEFLARRESVERVMVIRQREDLTQIGVLEDKVLVEHYVARESQTSLIGNIYLGRVQNVLPSMEAAFVDIGKGRNAVLYAGEVNWAALGHKDGQPRKIESVLSSGQTVLVQVTKDPIGHKGARLTSQISLAGRFLVYVPDGTTSGISRKLPDTERNRLKSLLKEIVPDSAGVIVRTAAEGASEEELTRDVERLKARWEDIEAKARGNAPQLLYGEPDLTLKVVRDLFTEDFAKLVIQGNDAWETVKGYVEHVAPDLGDRLQRFVPGEDGKDAFSTYRIDEQIAKGLDRKVWLPSGGSLIIDRTEAMTVVDVNTGKFTGSGGNLEETVTKNNLEAAEEIVRQLRLRDIGGIIVVDFIDMVLESNRDLVLRRLVECLGRDRTRHQVAEVTSLGLVQMTRKRIGTGLLEAFSETCAHCHGRGLIVHDHPVEEGKSSGVAPDEPRRSRRRGGRGKNNDNPSAEQQIPLDGADPHRAPTPAEFAAMARHHEEEALESIADAERSAEREPEETESVEARDIVASTEPAEAVVVEDFEDTSTDQREAAEAPETGTPTVKVVTRTRGRRGASRPAGGGSAETTAVAPVVITPEPAVVATAEVTTPEPPKVITRTRRGASRSVTTPEPTAAAEAAPSVSDSSDPAEDEQQVEHVPVKKRGARKR